MALFSGEKKMVVVADCGDSDFGFGICDYWVLTRAGSICVYVVLRIVYTATRVKNLLQCKICCGYESFGDL